MDNDTGVVIGMDTAVTEVVIEEDTEGVIGMDTAITEVVIENDTEVVIEGTQMGHMRGHGGLGGGYRGGHGGVTELVHDRGSGSHGGHRGERVRI